MHLPSGGTMYESKSILHNDNIKSYSSSKEEAVSTKEESHEVNRRKNYEEKLPFLCNFFYCFYCPYICRIKQVREDDVPTPSPQDQSDYTFPILRETWDPLYQDYLNKLEESKNGNITETKSTVKPPSLLLTCIRAFLSPALIWAVVCLLLGLTFSILQPYMCKFISKAAYSKEYGEDYTTPVIPFIILTLCPLFNALFDGLGQRIFFHFSGQLRSALCGIIFDKVFRLNMTVQSGLDHGQLLTLISTDARYIADYMPSVLGIFTLPVQFVVPLIIMCASLGASPLIALAATAVILPITLGLLVLYHIQFDKFLSANEERSKLTTEVFEGIRVVKLLGLESSFRDRIFAIREKQIYHITLATLVLQIEWMITHNLSNFVTLAVYVVWVFSEDATQREFGEELLSQSGYLYLMTSIWDNFPVMLQAIIISLVSFSRIQRFLLLPEPESQTRNEPEQSSDSSSSSSSSSSASPIVFQIVDGNFQWQSQEEEENYETTKQNLLTKQKSLHQLHIPTTTAEMQSILSREDSDSPAEAENASVHEGQLTTVHQSASAFSLFSLQNLNVSIRKGTLTIVIGNTGSGKSSFASVIVGDIPQTSGEVRMAKEGIAYCPQIPWIINGTIRQNITLTDDGDNLDYELSTRARIDNYNTALQVCALKPDLSSMAAGDSTFIGEKGMNLSGGQKARIQLARAVYSDRDFYVLDDPLSAVDAHTGQFLFEECICKQLRDRGKTVVLLTNQIHFLNRADHVIVLEDGRIKAQGTPEAIKESGIDFSQYLLTGNKDSDSSETNNNPASDPDANPHILADTPVADHSRYTAEDAKTAATQMLTEEEQEVGTVPFSLYFKFIKILLPYPLFFLFLILYFMENGSTCWISYWQGVIGTDQWEDTYSFHDKLYYFGYFALMSLAATIVANLIIIIMERRAERIIHRNLFNNVIDCPISFFDTTPMGRIINRFCGDLTQVDIVLRTTLIGLIGLWITFVGQVVIVAIDTPILWIAGFGSIVIFIIILSLYVRASCQFLRLESLARSPVLTVFEECLTGSGMTVIRNYNLETHWRDKFCTNIDEWTVRFVLFREGQKWGNVYCSFITCALLLSMCLVGWYEMKAAKIIVAITAATTFGGLGSTIVQFQVELSARMTGLQRVFHYSSNLPKEIKCLQAVKDVSENLTIATAESGSSTASHSLIPLAVDMDTKSFKVPARWPSTGSVQFDHVFFRYRPGLPFVLRDVSFTIASGEHIGICGRTGAGKSSLLFPLFRLVELDPRLLPKQVDPQTGFMEKILCDPTVIDDHNTSRGRILIDSYDIATVPLPRLRRSLAVIPQDPTLFSGTLRQNLDAQGNCTDSELWKALEMLSLKELVQDLDGGLDYQVTEGGSNFSSGQRQLLCFARAAVRKVKIILLDEATANVDVETDRTIQNAVHTIFKDQTIIVIAHRLNTIMNSNRIMVLSNGEISEFDSPSVLMNNPNSQFNSLVRSMSA